MSIRLSAALVIVLGLVGCQSPPPPEPDPMPQGDMPTTVPAPSPGQDAGTPSQWQCAEVHVAARFDDDSVGLVFSGRRLQLPQTMSASGARYADDKGNEFWTKGDTSRFTLPGDAPRDCTRSERKSPWQEAANQGVEFRAVGNEPGWFVEVGQGDTPALRATLDYGERKVEVARTVSLSSSHGWGGKTSDGIDVVLRVNRETCRDGMSGEAFEASAVLTVGDKTYHGCGAWLSD